MALALALGVPLLNCLLPTATASLVPRATLLHCGKHAFAAFLWRRQQATGRRFHRVPSPPFATRTIIHHAVFLEVPVFLREPKSGHFPCLETTPPTSRQPCCPPIHYKR
eukprot:scaffold44691_cov32-Tisochrysis_lutea.AAC.1